jgi:hypothetical protein
MIEAKKEKKQKKQIDFHAIISEVEEVVIEEKKGIYKKGSLYSIAKKYAKNDTDFVYEMILDLYQSKRKQGITLCENAFK